MKKFIIPLICTSFLLGGCPLKHVKQGCFENHRLSLKGDEKSHADIMTRVINSVMTTSPDSFEYEEHLTEARGICGERAFLVLAQKDCSNCKLLEDAMAELEENKSSYLKDKQDYRVHVIYVDEDEESSLFKNYVGRNTQFFEYAAAAAYSSNYYLNGKISDADIFAIESCDIDNMVTPTIFMVDFSDDVTHGGVRDVMFGAKSTVLETASLLADCILRRGDFSLN